jgi:hypothetical protein
MPHQCCNETWAKIPDDEPVFTVRGKDLLALGAVQKWIKDAQAAGVNQDKIDGAIKHRNWIQSFQVMNPERCKLPD